MKAQVLKCLTAIGVVAVSLFLLGGVILMNLAFYDQVTGDPLGTVLRWFALGLTLILSLIALLRIWVERTPKQKREELSL